MVRISLLLVVPALLAVTGCGYGDHTGRGNSDGYGANTCGTPVARGVIDTDATLEVEPATGVGVFVEYRSGGHWHVFVSCDTEQSDYDCSFDVIVQPLGSSKIASVTPEDLETDDDEVRILGGDAVQLIARTDFDFDGFTVDTDPGVGLSVDAVLDSACTNYVYWIGDGAVHEGAPSAPVEFEPSAE